MSAMDDEAFPDEVIAAAAARLDKEQESTTTGPATSSGGPKRKASDSEDSEAPPKRHHADAAATTTVGASAGQQQPTMSATTTAASQLSGPCHPSYLKLLAEHFPMPQNVVGGMSGRFVVEDTSKWETYTAEQKAAMFTSNECQLIWLATGKRTYALECTPVVCCCRLTCVICSCATGKHSLELCCFSFARCIKRIMVSAGMFGGAWEVTQFGSSLSITSGGKSFTIFFYEPDGLRLQNFAEKLQGIRRSLDLSLSRDISVTQLQENMIALASHAKKMLEDEKIHRLVKANLHHFRST